MARPKKYISGIQIFEFMRSSDYTPVPAPTRGDFPTVHSLWIGVENGSIDIDGSESFPWQRDVAWSPKKQGLLPVSIIMNYNINNIILSKKKHSFYPIDGKQRILSLANFINGDICIPNVKFAFECVPVPPQIRGIYFCEPKSEEQEYSRNRKHTVLSEYDRQAFLSRPIDVVCYNGVVEESTARQMFILLQENTPLVSSERRPAIESPLSDFVSELVNVHPFFQALRATFSNKTGTKIRKLDRHICDILLWSYLNPFRYYNTGSLRKMYAQYPLSAHQKKEFTTILTNFYDCVKVRAEDGRGYVLMRELKKTSQFLTHFQVFRELSQSKHIDRRFSFTKLIKDVEKFSSASSSKRWSVYNDTLVTRWSREQNQKIRHNTIFKVIKDRVPTLIRVPL